MHILNLRAHLQAQALDLLDTSLVNTHIVINTHIV
jgi:hypothetical protein